MGGVLVYLVGPGRENEHAEPHLGAGDPAVMAWHGDAELDRAAALEIARTLDHPRRAFGTRVTTPVKDTDGRRVGERDAHVWHCSLNLAADEGALSDEQWARICDEFVTRMGFAGDGVEHPCRWVAVRHGASKAGNEHVHVVVSLVHEDGRAANVWNDRPRAQQACGELERRHGLRVLESRAAGRGGARGHKPAERATATKQGSDELARERLERVVRACAAASVDEAEFVRRVRRAGVKLRPRYAAGRDDVVAGYSVALRAPAGQAPVYYGGRHLARDLTLPRLRDGWADTPDAAQAAGAQRKPARRNRRLAPPGRGRRSPSGRPRAAPGAWRRAGASSTRPTRNCGRATATSSRSCASSCAPLPSMTSRRGRTSRARPPGRSRRGRSASSRRRARS